MNVQELKIAIYGAGAMGTVLGGLLTKGGLAVDLITRNEEHVNALNTKGATIVCEADGEELCIPVHALTPKEMQGEYDVVFLMTKQRYNGEILKGLLPHLKKDGVVCTTQNGLPEPRVAKVVGNARTYGGATSFGASLLDGGRVALTSKKQAMYMEVGGYENDGAKLPILEEILSFAGKAVENEKFVKVTDNLLGARWVKLAINAAFSGLSVVTGMTFGEIARKRKTRKLALGVLSECVAVAKESGVTLAKMQGQDVEKLFGGKSVLNRLTSYLVLPFAMRKHKKLRSGMLKDVQSGKKCEIDFIDGIVVLEGKKVGVETPLCEKIVALVHDIEDGILEIDCKNVELFN